MDNSVTYRQFGCSCGAVDIHTHTVPDRFPAYLGSRKSVAWPSMAPSTQACHRDVVINGEIYRTVPDTCWSSDRRVVDIQAMGVGHQVLSPMPELLSYWLEAADAGSLLAFINEHTAEMVRGNPDRFSGLAAVPLQDIDLAIGEMERAVRQLGLCGIEVGSNVAGAPIGSPKFAPFFEAAEALNVAIFVHAVRPAGMDRLVGPPFLEQVLAFPGEIGLAAASLLTGGTLLSYPRLRIAFSHGGGSLPALTTRLQHAWESLPKLRETLTISPREMVKMMFYDALVYDRAAISNLVQVYGIDRLMLGSDYPFVIQDRTPVARVKDLFLESSDEERLLWRNAAGWLYGDVFDNSTQVSRYELDG